MTHWVVYDWKTAIAWQVTPATKANARREKELLGLGYEVMKSDEAARLRNAFAFGRSWGHKQARGERQTEIPAEALAIIKAGEWLREQGQISDPR